MDDCLNRLWFCFINLFFFILMIVLIYLFLLIIFIFFILYLFCYKDLYNLNNRRNFKFNRMVDNSIEIWCGCIFIFVCDNFYERIVLR